MEQLRFTKLSLLSNNERSGLQIDLSGPTTILIAGNGFGKSAILKTLYETLGATPPKIDNEWRRAAVTTLLEFSIEDRNYFALKVGKTYTVQDEERNLLINTSYVNSELGPYLANMFEFKLVLASRNDKITIPPPSYIFAPFYVDQDVGWQRAWASFKDLSMFPHSAKVLSEYHSGLRPNAYYEAKAERDRLRAELTDIKAELRAVDTATQQISELMPDFPFALNLQAFADETEQLLSESRNLHHLQAEYRTKLAELGEELHLWSEQSKVVEAALYELDASFIDAVSEALEVECPMCGQHYKNHISEQFELAVDKDELIQALLFARQKINELDRRLSEQRAQIAGIEIAIRRLNEILAVKKENISLQEVVAAEGRNEAHRVLNERLLSLHDEVDQKQRNVNEKQQRMRELDSRTRKQQINLEFTNTLERCAYLLDVKLPAVRTRAIEGANIGRGSEGARAQAAYYYAFLRTVRKYGSSAFCPIVIDAPNQQGQDQGHLKQILDFLLAERPNQAQVIIGSEAIFDDHGARIVDITHKDRKVLREDDFRETQEYIRPYLLQTLM